MPNISKEIQEKLDTGVYRIVEFDKVGMPILRPGEIAMLRQGLVLAYTENVVDDPKIS